MMGGLESAVGAVESSSSGSSALSPGKWKSARVQMMDEVPGRYRPTPTGPSPPDLPRAHETT